MFIYVDEYYNNLKLNKKKIDKDLIINTLQYLINKYNYNIKLPIKLVYGIIYFIKYNCNLQIKNNDLQTPYKLMFKYMKSAVDKLLDKKVKIIARISGRAEFGARALGNRSILANPSEFNNE